MHTNTDPIPIHRPTILVIDDDRAITHAVALRLTNERCRCVTATSGTEAISAYTLEDFDLVITDLDLPGIDGLGVVSLIRSQSDIPIIVISGFAELHAEMLKQFDNISIMAKPLHTHSLMQLVTHRLAA